MIVRAYLNGVIGKRASVSGYEVVVERCLEFDMGQMMECTEQ